MKFSEYNNHSQSEHEEYVDMTATRGLADLTPEQQGIFLEKTDRLVIKDGGLKSPFFDIQPGIIVGRDGTLLYDRPLISEKPSVLVVAWGRDAKGKLRLGIIRQGRPPADDPKSPGNDHPPVVFGQVAMGYFDDGESIVEAALRERLEEAGKGRVLGIEVLDFPLFSVEPNTYQTWHKIAFVEMDLSTIDAGHSAGDEMIHSVAYLPLFDVLRYITEGRDETGAYYRGGTTLGPIMVFLASKRLELFRDNV